MRISAPNTEAREVWRTATPNKKWANELMARRVYNAKVALFRREGFGGEGTRMPKPSLGRQEGGSDCTRCRNCGSRAGYQSHVSTNDDIRGANFRLAVRDVWALSEFNRQKQPAGSPRSVADGAREPYHAKR